MAELSAPIEAIKGTKSMGTNSSVMYHQVSGSDNADEGCKGYQSYQPALLALLVSYL